MKPLAAIVLVLAPWLLAAAQQPPPPADTEPAPDVHRGSAYIGEAAFVKVRALTVVYPAGPGELVDANRRSAEARARWLAAVHKCMVEVAADDQLTDEQKAGNLLVLGWTNRLFGSSGLERPFVHDANGTFFLGLKETDPAVDLVIFHRNPANWDSYLLFWSRIDPERDRSMVLPSVGSDWAMYRDYRPMRQGMFKPGRVWPPVRDPIAEGDHTMAALAASDRPGTMESPRYVVSFDANKFSSPDAKSILDAREAALTKAIAAVGSVPDGFRILLFVYEDEIVKRDATGVADPTHTVLPSRELYMVRRYARSSSPHEEVHLVARTRYGPCYSTAIYEGLAISVEGAWKGTDIDRHAALLSRQGRLPSIADLVDEERFRALPDTIGLPAAGVFMTWIRDAYGPEGVRKIYGWSEGGVTTMATALGTDVGALEASFAAWTAAKAVAQKNELDFLDAEDDARGKQIAGDWAGMAAALKRALVAKPGDPQTLFNLASAQMRAEDLTGAAATLKSLLGETLPPTASRFVVFGHYQLGRVYDLAGRRSEALKEYDAVLALPDDHGSHDLARERKTRPATKEQLE